MISYMNSDIIHTSGLLTASQCQQLMGMTQTLTALYSIYFNNSKVPSAQRLFTQGNFFFLPHEKQYICTGKRLEVVCQHRCARVTLISKFPSLCLLCTSINYSDKVDKPVQSYSKDKFI